MNHRIPVHPTYSLKGKIKHCLSKISKWLGTNKWLPTVKTAQQVRKNQTQIWNTSHFKQSVKVYSRKSISWQKRRNNKKINGRLNKIKIHFSDRRNLGLARNTKKGADWNTLKPESNGKDGDFIYLH
jgi:hypothetical protein